MQVLKTGIGQKNEVMRYYHPCCWNLYVIPLPRDGHYKLMYCLRRSFVDVQCHLHQPQWSQATLPTSFANYHILPTIQSAFQQFSHFAATISAPALLLIYINHLCMQQVVVYITLCFLGMNLLNHGMLQLHIIFQHSVINYLINVCMPLPF